MLSNAHNAMALPVIAGVVRCTYRGALGSGTQWANVMHFRYAGGASTPGITEITALEAKLRRLYTGTVYSGGAVWLAQCRSVVTLIDFTAYVLNGTAPPIVISSAAPGTNATATMCPQEVAPVMTLRTAKRGRSYRGRVYFPAPATNIVDATGLLLSTITGQMVVQATALQADLATIQWEWGVASYLHSTFEPVTQFTFDARPDVQRRRKR
jgi:hypothetical protein